MLTNETREVDMTRREDNRHLVESSEELATKWEDAVHLNGAGARAIRDLTNALRNLEQADTAMDMITEQYEKLLLKQDQLFQANLILQKELVILLRRVSKLEKGDK